MPVITSGSGDKGRSGAGTISYPTDTSKPPQEKKSKGILGTIKHGIEVATDAPVVKQGLWAFSRPQQYTWQYAQRLKEDLGGKMALPHLAGEIATNPLKTIRRQMDVSGDVLGGGTMHVDPNTGKVVRGDLDIWQGVLGKDHIQKQNALTQTVGALATFGTDPMNAVAPGARAGTLAKASRTVKAGLGAEKAAQYAREGGIALEGAEDLAKLRASVAEGLEGGSRWGRTTSAARAEKIADKTVRRLERLDPHAQLQIPGLQKLSKGRFLGKSQGAGKLRTALREGEEAAVAAAGETGAGKRLLSRRNQIWDYVAPRGRLARKSATAAETLAESEQAASSAANTRQVDIDDIIDSAVKETGQTSFSPEDQAIIDAAVTRGRGIGEAAQVEEGYEHLQPMVDVLHRIRVENLDDLAKHADDDLAAATAGARRPPPDERPPVTTRRGPYKGAPPEPVDLGPRAVAPEQPGGGPASPRLADVVPERVAPTGVADDVATDSMIDAKLAALGPGKPGLGEDVEDIGGAPGFVLRDDAGQPIGIVSKDADGVNVEVAKAARRQGHGDRLLQHAEDSGMATPEEIAAAKQTDQGAALVQSRAKSLEKLDPVQGPVPEGVGVNPLDARIGPDVPIEPGRRFGFPKLGKTGRQAGRQTFIEPAMYEQARELAKEADALGLTPAQVKELLADHPLGRLGVRSRSDLWDLVARGQRELGGATPEVQEGTRLGAYHRSQQNVASLEEATRQAPEDIQRAFAEASGLPIEEPVQPPAPATIETLQEVANPTASPLAAAVPNGPSVAPGASHGVPPVSPINPPVAGRTPAPALAGGNVDDTPLGSGGFGSPGGPDYSARRAAAGGPKPRPQHVVISEKGQKAILDNIEEAAHAFNVDPVEMEQMAKRRVIWLPEGHRLGDDPEKYKEALVNSLMGNAEDTTGLQAALESRGGLTEDDPFLSSGLLSQSVQNRTSLRNVVMDLMAEPDTQGLLRKLGPGEEVAKGKAGVTVPGVGKMEMDPALAPEFERMTGVRFQDAGIPTMGSGKPTKLFRAMALAYPGFTVKQTTGNIAATAAKGVGISHWARATKMQRAANKAYALIEAAQHEGEVLKFEDAIKQADVGEDIAHEVIAARKSGGFSPGFFREGEGLGNISRLSEKVNPLHPGFKGYNMWWRKAGASLEDKARLASWQKGLEDAGSARGAGRFVADTLFDYGDVTRGGRMAKALNPFITFTSKNLAYTGRLARENPAALAAMASGREQINALAGKDRLRSQEDFGKVYIPGLKRYVDPSLPIQDIERLAEIPMQAAAAAAGKPGAGQELGQGVARLGGGVGVGIGKAAAESATGRSTFTGADLKGGLWNNTLLRNTIPAGRRGEQIGDIMDINSDTAKGEKALTGLLAAPTARIDRASRRSENYRDRDRSPVNRRINAAFNEKDELEAKREAEKDRLNTEELPPAIAAKYRKAIAEQVALIKKLKREPGYVKKPSEEKKSASGPGIVIR